MQLLGWTSLSGETNRLYSKRHPMAACPRVRASCIDCNSGVEVTWPIVWVRSFLDGISREVRHDHPVASVRRWGRRKISFDTHADRFSLVFHCPWKSDSVDNGLTPAFRCWVAAGDEFMSFKTSQLYWTASMTCDFSFVALDLLGGINIPTFGKGDNSNVSQQSQ
jgi:hypothetical protein